MLRKNCVPDVDYATMHALWTLMYLKSTVSRRLLTLMNVSGAVHVKMRAQRMLLKSNKRTNILVSKGWANARPLLLFLTLIVFGEE